ncbi:MULTISPECIES: phosphotransferase [Amycolatopsis]|uniref:Phosphotransferase n=1 Tax=Amycolatopsis albidoflavus TaxID=102226 RepID=A0ABW5I0S6_9PSEU
MRGEEVVGLIDFDTAHPGPRTHDLGYAFYRLARNCSATATDSPTREQ